MAFFNFFTSFYSALQNPSAYSSFQKEMNLKAVEQVFFNSLSGMTSFTAVVLTESEGNASTNDNEPKAIRVRPIDIHDFILPEPCIFKNLKDRKRVIAMHPVAFPDSNFKFSGGQDEKPMGLPVGHLVECYFKSGPQTSGRLRGLNYRAKIVAEESSINLRCLSDLEDGSLQNEFDNGSPAPLSEFVGPPMPATEEKNLELKELAAKVGLTETILKAIREVESKGNLTAIRFEPHIFLRYRKDLSNVIPYKPLSDIVATDYTPSHTNKKAFDRAFKLDGPAAIKSTSFGLYQIVSKFADLSKSSSDIIKNALKNQESAQNFVNFFYQKPLYVSDQLLIAWFSANPTAAKYAKQKNWKEFALRYNGKQCCGPNSRNKYDEKLKAAYEKFSKTK